MPMKDWLHRLQPLQLNIVLTLSILYFLVQLFMSHITHALTLLVDAYHMLCNIIALTGCIVTIKYSSKQKADQNSESSMEEKQFVEVCVTPRSNQHRHERSLRNTFGWTRIDVLTMLIVCIFLASLCFSLLVEAVQTLIHIDHQDTMHHPISVLILGSTGLLLNGLCYLLIGGYTFHQGSFLHITSSGDVILDRVVSDESLRQGERRLSKTKRDHVPTKLPDQKRRQSISEMIRDVISSVFVIICCIIVYFANDENVSKFVDPLISIVSCIALLVLSYPYMKESCLILLQTIPASMDIEAFKADLLKSFDDIVSVHDLHVWQLTASKCVSTVHIIFQNPNVYAKTMDAVVNFFHEQGITIVTIQPEFQSTHLGPKDLKCLVGCRTKDCIEKSCCTLDNTEIHDAPLDLKVEHTHASNTLKPVTTRTTSMLSLNVNHLCTEEHAVSAFRKSASDTNVVQTATGSLTMSNQTEEQEHVKLEVVTLEVENEIRESAL